MDQTAAARAARAQLTALTATKHRLTIEGVKGPLSEWRFSDFDGRDLAASLRPTAEGDSVIVSGGQPKQFVMKPRAIKDLELPDHGPVTLPGGVVVPLGAQTTGSEKSAWFRLTFEASPMPAPWDASTTGYVTRLTFGLQRPPQVDATVQLERPVIVKLSYEGLTAADLPPLAIDAPGLEHEKTVELRFRPSTSSPRLLVRSTISDANLELRALSRLEVRPQQRAMLGYGLETMTVVIENVAAHGELRPVERSTPIAIELEGGARAESDELAFASGAASASLPIRSSGLGLVTITATASGVSGRAVIEQRFPTGALLAALVGGAVGGYARRFLKGARRSRVTRQILEGAIVALIAFVAGVLGVGFLDLPSALVATEAGAFLTGALAGFAGVSAIEAIRGGRGQTLD